MKKIRFYGMLAGILLLTSAANAQISVGAKGGLNVSTLNGFQDLDASSLTGFHFGGYMGINLGRNFALQPEVLFSTQGAKLEDQEVNLNYLNIPVMVRFLTKGGLFLEAGPQFGFNVNEVDLSGNLNEQFNNSDFSMAGGLGYIGKSQGFGIGARYNVGVSKVGDITGTGISETDFKNGVFQLSLYFRLFGGGKLKK